MAGYGSDAGFSAWLVSNGHQLPVSAPSPAVLRQRGSDYVDGFEDRFHGVRTAGYDQERAWGRTGAVVRGQTIDPATIPIAIVNASYAAAWHEANNEGSLSPSATQAGAIKRKKIDVLETEYFEGSGDAAADARVRLPLVESMLAPFLKPDGVAAFGLWAVG